MSSDVNDSVTTVLFQGGAVIASDGGYCRSMHRHHRRGPDLANLWKFNMDPSNSV